MRITAVALAAVLAACSNDGVAPPATLSGTYTLQTIDGQPLPRLYRVETGREHYLVGGSITFSGQNTAIFTQLWREHDVAPNPERWSDPPAFVVTMTYTRSGNNLTIMTTSVVVPEGSMSISGDGASITLQFALDPFHYDRNHEFVFRRA